VLEGVKKEIVLFFLESLLDVRLLIDGPKQLIVRFDLGVSDEGPTDGAGDWFVGVVLEHAFDAVIAEKMVIGTCEHRPSAHDVVGFETYIADNVVRTLSLL
jgi:hypothetical protein